VDETRRIRADFQSVPRMRTPAEEWFRKTHEVSLVLQVELSSVMAAHAECKLK
jgi:hypothetical protein